MRFLSTFTLLFTLLFSGNSYAQKVKNYEDLNHRVKEAVRISSQLVSKDERTFDIQFNSLGKFKIYADSIKFFNEKQGHLSENHFEILKKPKSIQFLDPVTKKLRDAYKGESVFELKSKAALPKSLVVQFQACSDDYCLLVTRVRHKLNFFHEKNNQTALASNLSVGESLSAKLKSGLSSNSFLITLLILFLAGILTAFSPCVYPLYPITLGVFSRWAERNKNQAFKLVILFCIGLTFSYALLGLVAASSGSLFASMTQTPAFLIGMGLLILLAAVAFSGVFSVQTPLALQNKLQKLDMALEKKGLHSLQAFVMGATLGLVASPCVGPVLVALLAWLSKELSQGDSAYLKGFIMLSFFGMGMSVPFLILGHFMIRLNKNIKMSFIGKHMKKVGTILLIIGALFFLIPGFQQLNRKALSSSGEHKLNFPVYSYNKKPAKWTVVDFRADWCAACIELEDKTFNHPDIENMFNADWAMVTVDMTENVDPQKTWAEENDVISLPNLMILNPEGKECKSKRLFEFENAVKFKRRLEEAKMNCI